MNFCPNCGEKISHPSKFCPNCGQTLEDESKPNDESFEAETSINEEFTRPLPNFPSDEHTCAIDGEHIGFWGGRVELSDGKYVCQKHWSNVYSVWPNAKDPRPSFKEFWIKLNDPNHVIEHSTKPYPKGIKPFEKHLEKNSGSQTINIYNQAPTQTPKKTYHSGLHCPRCKSANIQLISSDANIKKVKHTTSIDVNPLHPLTVFKHNEKVVKKHSAGKIAAGVMTGGASLLVTGTRSNKSHQYHCNDCGHVWNAK